MDTSAQVEPGGEASGGQGQEADLQEAVGSSAGRRLRDQRHLGMNLVDIRSALEFEVTYTGITATCTSCKDGTLRADVVVVKMRRDNHPLGQLVIRCPGHQGRQVVPA